MLVMMTTSLAGCIKDDDTIELETITGVIEDVDYVAEAFQRMEKTTVLFEDGRAKTFHYGGLHELYLLARRNIGNRVNITYHVHHKNFLQFDDFDIIEEN